MIKRELKYMSTVQSCKIGVVRTHANTQNGDLYSIIQPLKYIYISFSFEEGGGGEGYIRDVN